MKQLIAAVLIIVIIISLIVVAFTVNQVAQEEVRLKSDMQYRSALLADSLKETVEPNFINKSNDYLQTIVDKLDYTKGILERLKAIEIFLNKYPSYQGNFTFIQIAAPSRTKVQKYRDFALEVEKEVQRINSLFKTKKWKPILFLGRHHSHEEIQKFYKLANFCLVTSLHDGMNLVAKEFVATRDDEKGVLILSQFTGASRELKEAFIVNPYNGEQTADKIKEALEMKPFEQTKRMRDMREVIKNYNVFRWSAELLKSMINLG